MDKDIKQIIEKHAGLACEEIASLDSNELADYIEKKLGRKLTYSLDPRFISRGNPLLALGRYETMENVDKEMCKRLKIKRMR